MWRQKVVSFSSENKLEEKFFKPSEKQLIGTSPHSKQGAIPSVHHRHLQKVSCNKKCSSVLTASYGSLGQLEVTCPRSSFTPLPVPQMPSLRSLVCRNRTQQPLQTAFPDASQTPTSNGLPCVPIEVQTSLKRDVSCTSLGHCKVGYPDLAIRKCETAMGLSSLAMDDQSQKAPEAQCSTVAGLTCSGQNSKGAQVHRPLNRRERECRRPFVSSRNLITREISASTRNLLLPLRREFSASCTTAATSSFPSPSSTSPLLLLHSSGNGTDVSEQSGEGPMKPVNRLRMSCSRCSSLMSLSASRLSLGVSSPLPHLQTVHQEEETFLDAPDDVPISEAKESPEDKNECGSNAGLTMILDQSESEILLEVPSSLSLCKLCLTENVKGSKVFKIQQCGCLFCQDCMNSYVEFEIQAGAYDISCPDAQCPTQGVMSMTEIETLVGPDLTKKHQRFRLYREVDLDVRRVWCPVPGCETVCTLSLPVDDLSLTLPFCPPNKPNFCTCPPERVICPTCSYDFCSACRKPSHAEVSCDVAAQLWGGRWAGPNQGTQLLLPPGVPPDSELIKCCPMCCVPIEKDEGCAQMMCKRCKHVFCWYCLTSLDDDFLLRHYDKGPCKNKLGHSRASVIWHRAQVIGIFAGFGILLLVASPLLLLAAPCIVCCKCRVCTGATGGANGEKLEEEEEEEGGGGESIGIVAGKVAAGSLKKNATVSDTQEVQRENS